MQCFSKRPLGEKSKAGPEPEVIATDEAVVTKETRTPRVRQVMVSLKHLLLGHTLPEGLQPGMSMDLIWQNPLQAGVLTVHHQMKKSDPCAHVQPRLVVPDRQERVSARRQGKEGEDAVAQGKAMTQRLERAFLKYLCCPGQHVELNQGLISSA